VELFGTRILNKKVSQMTDAATLKSSAVLAAPAILESTSLSFDQLYSSKFVQQKVLHLLFFRFRFYQLGNKKIGEVQVQGFTLPIPSD